MTGGPSKEHRPNKPPPAGRVQERSKGDATCPTTSQNPSCISAEQCVCHQEGPWVKWLARENLETNPITIKPETVSHMAKQSSWVPLPSCFLPEQVKVAWSCLTLCDPMDYTVHGILQARILWVAFPYSRGSSKPRDQTQASCIAGDSLPAEPQRKPLPSQVSCFVSMCLLGQFISEC